MLKIFECFSGYGGWTFGLQKIEIPFEVGGYSEINKYAIQCYEQNHINMVDNWMTDENTGESYIDSVKLPEQIKNFGDCTKINPNNIPDFDLLCASPPCQNFSICGKGLGNKVQNGKLFENAIDIMRIKQPRYAIYENVRGLTFKKHKEYFEYILKLMEECGYFVTWGILNTKDYGIPQNRERIFIVCFKNEEDYNKFEFPKKELLSINVKNILTNGEREKVKNKRITRILNSPTGKLNPIFELKNDTPSGISRQGDRIYSTISPCLNCVQKEVKFYINNEVTVLTGREHMRLMGFLEDEIKLDGLSENKIKDLAGNGLSINVVSKIFEMMFK